MIKKILWFHRYTTFNFYLWQIRVGSLVPEYSAIICSSVVNFFVIFDVALVIRYIIKKEIVPSDLGPMPIIILGLVIIVLNYLYISKKKYKLLKEEFLNQTENEKQKGIGLTIMYVLLVFVCFGLLTIFTARIRFSS